MKIAHLFAGAGGGLLADTILGHEPVLAVEQDKNCCAVLRNHAADGWFPSLSVWEGDVRLFDPSEWAGRVDAIHAGFPCQDISAAGKGHGITGERSGLVSEVFRAIDAIRPRFVFLENSPRIRTRGRDVVIGELVARGYAWRDGIIGAADVGAWHQRDRWFCLAANADGMGRSDEYCTQREILNTSTSNFVRQGFKNGGRSATTETEGDIRRPADLAFGKELGGDGSPWFEVEPNLERLVYGVAAELVPGAVKALGNGQVPLQAAAAYLLLGGLAA